jgi:hypothetical protein
MQKKILKYAWILVQNCTSSSVSQDSLICRRESRNMLGYWLRTAQAARFKRTALYAEENPEICLDIGSELHS